MRLGDPVAPRFRPCAPGGCDGVCGGPVCQDRLDRGIATPDDPAVSTPVFLVVSLWLAGLAAAAQFGKIGVVFDSLATLYPGPAAVGFVVSLVGVVGLVFGTTAGLLIGRAGTRRVLLGALMLGAAVSLFQSGLPTLPVMLASRVIEGVSHLAIVVACPLLIAQVSAPRHIGFTMTLWSTFFGVSFTLTAWLGVPFATAHGPAALFTGHAALMAGAALLLWWQLPRDVPVGRRVTISAKALFRQHLAIYRSARIAAPGLGFVFYAAIYVAVLTVYPPFLPEAWRAFVSGAMPLASIVVSLTVGVALLRRMSAVRVVQLGLALTVLTAVALWLAQGVAGAVVGLSLAMAASLGLVQGASFAAIPELNATASDRAAAAGALAQLGNVGTTTGTPILVGLTAALGFSGVPLFAAVLGLAAALVVGRLGQRRVREAAGSGG